MARNCLLKGLAAAKTTEVEWPVPTVLVEICGKIAVPKETLTVGIEGIR